MREALIAYTLGAAFACQVEEQVGTLEKGKLADLVVLSHLPDETAFGKEWEQIRVEAVLVDGVLTYWQESDGGR